MSSPPPDIDELLHRLQRAGLVREVDDRVRAELTRAFASASDAAQQVEEMLHAYYGAHGDSVEALWRRQQDKVVDVEAEAPPELVLRGVQHALPVLEGLHCRLTPHTMEVATDTDGVAVSRVEQDDPRRARVHRVPVTSPRHIVFAVNQLLSRVGHRCRFIPLRNVAARQAYVAVPLRDARSLQRLGITALRDIDEMLAFAAWDHGDGARPRRVGS